MNGTSLILQQEKINTLREVLPEAFSEGKIDWEKLKATRLQMKDEGIEYKTI